MEDYKKKYDELLLKLQKAKVDDNVCDEMYYRVIDNIVPELKESEDEKVRKHIISVLEDCWQTCKNIDYDSSMIQEDIAWLKKQGEQKQDPCEHCDDKRLNCHNFPCVKKRAFKQGKSALEAINEEKVDNANKVEQKFKVGDWVTCKEIDTALIVNITDDKYEVEFIDGNKGFPHIDYVDRIFSLWTIQNTKDGDVLYSPTHHLIWIYKDNEHYYACVNMNYVTENVATNGLISIPNDACPATKEQREQLEKAMADDGYAFDFDKKKLKKIEQKPVSISPIFEVGDVMCTKEEATKGLKSGMPVVVSIDKEYYHCNNELIAIKDQYDYEYPPMNRIQKPAWSEEDKKTLERVIRCIENHDYMNVDDIQWLKSLKDRHTWKPSDEQLDALQYIYRNLNPPLSDKLGWNSLKTLELMYHDLKKLK